MQASYINPLRREVCHHHIKSESERQRWRWSMLVQCDASLMGSQLGLQDQVHHSGNRIQISAFNTSDVLLSQDFSTEILTVRRCCLPLIYICLEEPYVLGHYWPTWKLGPLQCTGYMITHVPFPEHQSHGTVVNSYDITTCPL